MHKRKSEESSPVYRTSSVHVFDSIHEQLDDPSVGDMARAKATEWWRHTRSKAASYTFFEWMALLFPCVSWLSTYSWRENLASDALAGISIGFMVVPQGMSYALLAGVPPVWGLYGALVPVLVYAVFGSSRHLAVGPVAVTSLLIGTAVPKMVPGAENINDSGDVPEELAPVQAEYNQTVIQVCASYRSL
jgi:hypothetical protein